MVAAGFSAGRADAVRRGMAAWKRRGGLEEFRADLLAGMAERGYPREFAERIYSQIEGFADYGFPESHAASFALLTWASAWLKCHHPAAFTCALLNSQPMGFYSPSQLVQDARRHGVQVRPVDVRYSQWDCSLEDLPGAPPALRLGLRMVSGLAQEAAEALARARVAAPFRDVADLCLRAGLGERSRVLLAEAGALRGRARHRQRVGWAATGVVPHGPLLPAPAAEDAAPLPVPGTGEDRLADHAHLGLSVGPHPLRLLRVRVAARRYRPSRELEGLA